MKFLFVFQYAFLLWLLCPRSTAKTSDLQPLVKPKIKPIVVNKTWDDDAKVSKYYMRFLCPSDTQEEFGFISLVEVEKKDQLSVFESNAQVPLGDYMSISLISASLSETFKMTIVGDTTSASQTKFPGKSCEFETSRNTNGQFTHYVARKNEDCKSKPKEDLDIFTYYEVNFLKDHNIYRYKGMEEDGFDFWKYIRSSSDADSVLLSTNDGNIQADGIKLDNPILCILVMKYLPIEQNVITVYGWKLQVV